VLPTLEYIYQFKCEPGFVYVSTLLCDDCEEFDGDYKRNVQKSMISSFYEIFVCHGSEAVDVGLLGRSTVWVDWL
jgi:hypothetical protein